VGLEDNTCLGWMLGVTVCARKYNPPETACLRANLGMHVPRRKNAPHAFNLLAFKEDAYNLPVVTSHLSNRLFVSQPLHSVPRSC
jgi:hypothetical protein